MRNENDLSIKIDIRLGCFSQARQRETDDTRASSASRILPSRALAFALCMQLDDDYGYGGYGGYDDYGDLDVDLDENARFDAGGAEGSTSEVEAGGEQGAYVPVPELKVADEKSEDERGELEEDVKKDTPFKV